jgi:diguanylate cyclase (GGDEF)-like protein/PAS domain S-box-containing protein
LIDNTSEEKRPLPGLKPLTSALTVYITLVCLSGVLNLLLMLHVLMRRNLYGSVSSFFVLAMAATATYCFAYAFSLTSSTLGQLRFWSVIQYFGMPFAPAFGLLFVMRYLGYRLSGQRVAAMLAIPAMALISNATNEWHHLHYKQYNIHELLGAPYNDIEVGPTYIIMGCYILVCFLASYSMLISRWMDTARPYRQQIVSLFVAQMIPMTTSFLYLIGVTPEGIDPVPMVTGLSSILMWWTIESSRLLTIIPIAKETIFHSISDGVVVLDESGKLVEYNESCRRMFPRMDRSMFGQSLKAVWFTLFGKNDSLPVLNARQQEIEVISAGSGERVYRVRVSPLRQNEKRNQTGTVMIISDITEMKMMQQKLERHAYFDELTQICNRRAFFERCEKEYVKAKRGDVPFTIVLFDIDNFKKVNDTYGHNAGDQVLVHVANIINSCLKENMLFARYGGEEFVLALFGKTVSYGKILAESLRQQIASRPLVLNGTVIRVTSSFGVAEASGDERETLQNLLHCSDKALYEAKRGGRNRVSVYKGARV